MTLTDSQVRAWIDSMVGCYGPQEGTTPNSPVADAFLRGVFLGTGYIPTYLQLKDLSTNSNLRAFHDFIWEVWLVLDRAGVKHSWDNSVHTPPKEVVTDAS